MGLSGEDVVRIEQRLMESALDDGTRYRKTSRGVGNGEEDGPLFLRILRRDSGESAAYHQAGSLVPTQKTATQLQK